MPESARPPPRVKYCGGPKIGAGGKPVMKFDIVAGPSVVMYAIGCFRRAALDITWCVSGWHSWLEDEADLGS